MLPFVEPHPRQINCSKPKSSPVSSSMTNRIRQQIQLPTIRFNLTSFVYLVLSENQLQVNLFQLITLPVEPIVYSIKPIFLSRLVLASLGQVSYPTRCSWSKLYSKKTIGEQLSVIVIERSSQTLQYSFMPNRKRIPIRNLIDVILLYIHILNTGY